MTSVSRIDSHLTRIDSLWVYWTPSIRRYPLYTWEERGAMSVKYLAQEHNAGLEPGPHNPESSALTIRPLRPVSQDML